MNRYKARELALMGIDQAWELEPGKILLEFDDGVIHTTGRRTLFCWYMWELHRKYPNTPMLKSHHMGMSQINGSTHSEVMNNIYWDLFEVYKGTIITEKVWKLIYEITGTIFNDFTTRCDQYVVSMSGYDVLGIMMHPGVKEITDNIKPTQKSIDAAYDAFAKIMKTDNSLKNNEIASALRGGFLSMKQAQQCFVATGFRTEIDSTIFPIPVTVGYARGIRKLSDSMIESRSATKALIYAKYFLSECEYFNRKLQLGCGVVTDIFHGDCGSNHTMPWKVEDAELKSMHGLHYIENGVLKTITPESKQLVGKVVHLRTPWGCQHPDKQTVCSTCMGEIGLSIPIGTSPGHVAAISLGEKITQLVLSTKHHDGSSSVDDIVLDEFSLDYLTPGAEGITIRLSPKLAGKKVKIIISAEDAKGIPSLMSFRDFDDVEVDKITEMSSVTFIVESDNPDEEPIVAPVTCSMGSRLGSLTREALYYIQENVNRVLSIDDNGDYTIDLCDWDSLLSLFVLPMKHTNMLDYMQSVSTFILSGDASGKSRGETLSSKKFKDNPVAAIKMLLSLVNSKLNINATHVMLVAYSMSAINPFEGNYHLPKAGQKFTFVRYEDLMTYRSLGTKLAYQDQPKALRLPQTYVIKDKPAGRLDEMILG